jgi:predicted DNA-binding protein (UPF0251 family)
MRRSVDLKHATEPAAVTVQFENVTERAVWDPAALCTDPGARSSAPPLTPNEELALAELEEAIRQRGPLLYEEIAERLGVSRQRVQQIEERAFNRMRKACRLRGLGRDFVRREDSV